MKRLACALAVVAVCVVATSADEKKESSKLSLTVPKSVTLKPGETKDVRIQVGRDGFDEDVTITFDNLPKGVKIDKPDQKVKKGEKGADYVLIAMESATAGDHKIKIVASAKQHKATRDLVVTIKK